MIGVGHVAEIFDARQIVEIKLGGVRQKELVTAGIDDELRHREPIAILVRFFNLHQGAMFFSAHPIHDLKLGIIVDCRRPEAIGLEMMSEGRLDI